jgi:hypothetical protein
MEIFFKRRGLKSFLGNLLPQKCKEIENLKKIFNFTLNRCAFVVTTSHQYIFYPR